MPIPSYSVDDWRRLVADLTDNGWTQRRIAERIGVSQSSVSELMTDERRRDVSFTFGAALFALHEEVCGGLHAGSRGRA